MADGQSAFAEPMSMSDALAKADTLIDQNKEAPADDDPQEDQDQGEEIEATAEEDAPEPETEAEELAEDDSPQVLTADEYGDVLVDVKGESLALSDLIANNLRQADYSRKTQELSEQRKEMEAVKADLVAREQQLAERLAETEAQEPDWVALAKEDPLGYAEQKAQWDFDQKKRAQIKAQADKQREDATRAFVAKTVELAVEAMPEWRDAKKFDAGADARKDQALKLGFTTEEYNATADFRLAALLEKAARYDDLVKQQKGRSTAAEKKLAKAPKVLKPGQSRGASDPAAERRAAFRKAVSKPISSETLRGYIGR